MAFRNLLKQHNIKLQVVTPYWPFPNGDVEHFNRTLGKTIMCSHAKGKGWKKKMQFLIQYRTTPHTVTNVPPTQLMFHQKQPKAHTQVNKDDPKRKQGLHSTGHDS